MLSVVARAWIITYHLLEDEDYEDVLRAWTATYEHGGYRFLVCQLEEGKLSAESEEKRWHLQTYCELGKPIRLRGLQRLLGGRRFHAEPREGTREQARAYSRKLETRKEGPWEIGKWSAGGQGARTDAHAVLGAIRAGSTIRDIALERPGYVIRYHKGIQYLKGLFDQERKLIGEKVACELYWGKSRAGKSWKAFSQGESDDTYVWRGGKWWDGYDGQSLVICDDFADLGVERIMPPLSELLRVLQRYRHSVEIKGAQVVLWQVKRFIFTSNIPLEKWYAGEPEERQVALKNRFTYIEKFDNIFTI